VLMAVTVLASIMAMSAMIYLRQPNVPAISQADYRAHIIISYITLPWMILQLIIGFVSSIMQSSDTLNPKMLLTVRAIHRYSGYLLLILCKANVVLGWAANNQQIAVGVVVADIMLILGLAILYRLKFGGHLDLSNKVASVHAKEEGAVGDSSAEELMNLPYNDARVQQRNIVVFDDKIYQVSNPNFHPGGRQILKLANGREIDRFLYGLSNLEMYPELTAVEHPKNALSLLGAPVGVVPVNPVLSLPVTTFHANHQLSISPNLSLFTFEPEGDKLQLLEVKNLRHLGQYFAVSGFGKVRLYSLVLSQMKGNRHLCGHIVNALVPAERQLKSKLEEVSLGKALEEQPSYEALGVTGLASAAKLVGEDSELPLLIKRYHNAGAFTNMLYSMPQTPVTIEGPKGRGLCLEALAPGSIAIIAGGSGLFPFLDLIDLVFKGTVKHESIPVSEVKLAEAALARHAFNFFISVDSVQDLVVPDQLQLICKAKSPKAQVQVRVKERVPSWAFQGCQLHERIGQKVVEEFIQKISRLQMVYICGPQAMYRDLVQALREGGVSEELIFFV